MRSAYEARLAAQHCSLAGLRAAREGKVRRLDSYELILEPGEHVDLFDGKTLDFSDDRGFFLRGP